MSSFSPLVSVITVCYNEEKRIDKTASSIAGQTSENYEWIIIDGQSTDETLVILDKYKKHISSLVSEKDTGIYNAMNKGIRLAKGEYCIFINGGDRFFNNQAVSQFEDENNKAEVNYGGIVEINSIKKNRREKYLKPIENYKDYLYRYSFHHQSCFIRTDLLKKYGCYDENYLILADWDFCVKTIVQGRASVHHLPFIIAIFYFDGLSAEAKGSTQFENEVKMIRNRYFGHFYKYRLLINVIISKIIGRGI
jgi:glycosyltransferase involved in cell wall biosynthesis